MAIYYITLSGSQTDKKTENIESGLFHYTMPAENISEITNETLTIYANKTATYTLTNCEISEIVEIQPLPAEIIET